MIDRIRVKICGITNTDDALCAIKYGADAIGFIFVESPRRVTLDSAASIISSLPPFVARVGVFLNQSQDEIKKIYKRCGLNCVQLHGDESCEFCDQLGLDYIKVFRIKDRDSVNSISEFARNNNNKNNTFLLDTYSKTLSGGTGKTFNWDLATEAKSYGRIILSGGLCPENIGAAIKNVQPYAVDVSSGVEACLGKKDHNKIKLFMREIYK